jgi:hypothetical protein
MDTHQSKVSQFIGDDEKATHSSDADRGRILVGLQGAGVSICSILSIDGQGYILAPDSQQERRS